MEGRSAGKRRTVYDGGTVNRASCKWEEHGRWRQRSGERRETQPLHLHLQFYCAQKTFGISHQMQEKRTETRKRQAQHSAEAAVQDQKKMRHLPARYLRQHVPSACFPPHLHTAWAETDHPIQEHHGFRNGAVPSFAVTASQPHSQPASHLAEAAGLALCLQQGQDVAFSDRALDIADDGAAGVVHELHTDLGDTTSGASAAEDFGDLAELWLCLHISAERAKKK